jgi:glycosyltransferase involved in cell wall biosynthesis
MNNQTAGKICLTPVLHGVGGMVSFQHKLTEGLVTRGIEVSYDLEDGPFAAVLVIGGTRQIRPLLRLKRQGIRIVQRLDGMNWLHRKVRTGTRHYIRSTYGNWLLELIRTRVADRIVYQSNFAQAWWERAYGPVQIPQTVIYNGVDVNIFSPYGKRDLPEDSLRILMVEGSLMGGYEIGLESAFQLAVGMQERLFNSHSHYSNRNVELFVVGQVADAMRTRWSGWLARQSKAQQITITWAGLTPHEQIPEIDRSAHLVYSSDLNAACPNSTIEAMACGTPVVAFDTGAIPELLAGEGGRIASYGGDPWKLDPPNISALVQAAYGIVANIENYRTSARSRAVTLFDVDLMVERYLDFLLNS